MIKLLKHLKFKDWLLVLLSIGLIIYQVYLDLELPGRMQVVTKLITSGSGSVREILKQGGFMLAYAFMSLLTAVLIGYVMARVATNFAFELRENVFSSIQAYNAEEINKFETSSLITRTTNDVNNVQFFITMSVQLLIKAPILSVWSIRKIYDSSIEWTKVTAFAVGLILVLIIVLMIILIPKIRRVQKLTDELTLDTQENLTGVRVIRAYNAESYQEERFEKTNSKLTKINLFAGKGFAVLNPTLNLIINILMLAVYFIGAQLIFDIVNPNPYDQMVAQGEIFANMIVFVQYAMMVIMSFMMLVMSFFILPRTIVSANRINEVIKTTPSVTPGTVTNTDSSGVIEFKNVSFKYPDAEECVLKNINLTINRGERIAFIGSTGSGKSTLINLLPRFYDVTEGEILIDGINVKDFTFETLNQKIGYVSQKAVLFKDSVRNNVGYGNLEVEDKKVWHALEVAAGADFVKEKEEDLDYEISQSGTNLSGGQKQRISIARAVYKNPDIFIFDDSFSALDFRTDKLVRDNLKENFKDVTTLVVAQRIGTIMDASQIVVLDNGEIVGLGRHEDLIKNNKVYQDIAYSQLSRGELE